jgi:hypothetical protein
MATEKQLCFSVDSFGIKLPPQERLGDAARLIASPKFGAKQENLAVTC